MVNDFQMSKNFNGTELQCHCCQQIKIGGDFLKMVQAFRDNINAPMNINCQYRCKVHNQEVGGEPNSYHMQGRAIDFSVSGKTYGDLVWLCNQLGFTGFGIYPDQCFVHMDNGDRKACWVKYSGKPYQYMSYEQLMNRPEMKQVLK